MSLKIDELKDNLRRIFTEQIKQEDFVKYDSDTDSTTTDEEAFKGAKERGESIANQIAVAIDEFVKSGTVKVVIETGLVTQGAGLASAPNTAPIPVTGDPDATAILKGGIS